MFILAIKRHVSILLLLFILASSAWAETVRPAITAGVRRIETLPTQEQPNTYLQFAKSYPDLTLAELVQITDSIVRILLTDFESLNIKRDKKLALFYDFIRTHEQVAIDFYQRTRTDLDVNAVIIVAKNAGSNSAQDTILLDFANFRNSTLSVDEVLLLARAATATLSPRDNIIEQFVKENMSRLTEANVSALAQTTASSAAADRVLSAYATDPLQQTMSVEKALRLAKQTASPAEKNRILIHFLNETNTITVSEALNLASAANYESRDVILKKFVSKNYSNLSFSEAINLAKATASSAAQDSILFDYTKSQLSRLSITELRRLAEATASSASKRQIESLMDNK